MGKPRRAWVNDPYKLPWRKEAFKGVPRRPQSTWDRFNSKLLPGPGDCWAWAGAHFKTGYTLFVMRGSDEKWRPALAHRIAYELYIDLIPDGFQIDHLCRNRGCVNPWHMEAVPQRVNILRSMSPSAIAHREDRCQQGHEFTPENTILRPNRPGKRECRECVRARDRARNKTEKRRAHYRAMYRRRKATS